MTEYINSDLIYRTALWDAIRTAVAPFNVGMVCRHIHKAPAVDAVEVVRCKDCRYFEIDDGYDGGAECIKLWPKFIQIKPDDFCSRGEKKKDTQNLKKPYKY